MEKKIANEIGWLSDLKIINTNSKNSILDISLNDSVSNSKINNCFHCYTQLSTKNICNLCFNLFCNSCINEFENVKLCQNCILLSQHFNKTVEDSLIKTTGKINKYTEITKESFYCKTYDNECFSCQNFLASKKPKIEEQLLKDSQNNYELIMKTFINYFLNINFKSETIEKGWKNIIYKLVKEVITNLHPCSRYLNDSLDISNYLKIKIIPYKDNSKCKVIKGYIFSGNKEESKIKVVPIHNPKILLIGNLLKYSKEEGNNNINVKEISKDIEIYYSKLIENKLNIVKPDIVIIENNFPKEIINMIINNNIFENISFIYGVKNNIIKNLSRCTQTLVIPSFKLIGNNKIIGSCKKFYIEKDIKYDYSSNQQSNNQIKNEIIEKNKNEIINIKDKKETNLFVFDDCNKILYNTIILSGNDIDFLKKMKKLLKQILIPSIRDWYLQSHIIYRLNMEISPFPQNEEKEIEKLIKENNEIILVKSEKNNRSKQKIINQGLSIDKLFYKGFDLSIIEKKEDFNIYNLTLMTSSQKNKTEIIKEEDISESEIHKTVNKYCENPIEINYSFFNENPKYDKSLGKFILNLCKRSSLICNKCNLENKNHTLYLYRAEGFLKIWMLSENEKDIDKILNYLNKTTNTNFKELLEYKNEINSISEIVNEDIYTYGYCNICKSIVTPLFKINNEVFNYSSSKFIRFMLENHYSKNQKRNFKYNISKIISNKKCEHLINKDISRIFITRFGSWIFEYNEIIKHYISPMNLEINDLSKKVLFNKYSNEGYSNSINIITLIQKALSYQEIFFTQLLKDEKLGLFQEYINFAINIIQSIHSFNEQCMIKMINKYLKENTEKYNNNFSILIVHIKKIYLKIINLKLIINRIERTKRKIQVISDILNNKLPITLEENRKLNENHDKKKKVNNNKIDSQKIKLNFVKNDSFQNILKFVNFSDNKHDYYSCEFIQDDISSYIANALSSNDYIEYMNTKQGINLTKIKRKRECEQMIDDIISYDISQKRRRFSSLIQIREKTDFFEEISRRFSEELSFDEDRDTSEMFDTMLIFDQSKQFFSFEKEEGKMYDDDDKIKKILEKELNNDDTKTKNIYLDNKLFSILIAKKKSDDKNKSSNKNSIDLVNNNNNSNNNDNNIGNNNGNTSLDSSTTSDDKKDGDKNENDKLNIIQKNLTTMEDEEVKKEYNKVYVFFNEIEIQVYNSNKVFRKSRKKLINLIKEKIEKEKLLNEKKKLHKKEKSKENNENNNSKKENTINVINEKDKKKKNEEDKKDKNKEKEDYSKYEKIIPSFKCVPEFVEICKETKRIAYEERFINQDSDKIEVIIYYPKQFEALRIAYCSTLEDLLISLNKSKDWDKNTGGKSKARFYKTHDERFILKNINENEFNMFIESGLDYFKYMSKFLFHKMPSVLAKILGAYKIIIKGDNKELKYNLILMENIYFGIFSEINCDFNSPESNIRVYDLKGSNVNRYINKNRQKPGQVLLDTNFLLDFNKEPVFIESDAYDRLYTALYNDSSYLKKIKVIDYSLLVIFKGKNEKNKKEKDDSIHRLIKFGIIDYTRKYTLDKQLESYGKTIYYGENPTIIDPEEYRQRFFAKISKYFVGV